MAEYHTSIDDILTHITYIQDYDSNPAEYLRKWLSENLVIYTLSDTCPMCEMVKDRLRKLGITCREMPASACPEHDHFPVAKISINQKEAVFSSKELIVSVNYLEKLLGKDVNDR